MAEIVEAHMALIFIECGTSMTSPFHTGIQRVVRNIVRECETVGLSLGHECIPVNFSNSKFRLLEHVQLSAPQATPKPSSIKRFLLSGVRVYKSIKHHVPRPLHKCVLWTVGWLQRVAEQISVKAHHYFLRLTYQRLPPTIDEVWNQRKFRELPLNAGSPPILLLLDSTWNMKFWPAVDKFRAAGGQVTAVLYDLIPFTHPDTVEEHTRNAHTSWWLEAPKRIDSVICISNTVRSQYLLWQKDSKLSRQLPQERVGYFYLGSEIYSEKHETDDQALSLGNEDPYCLVVGSIEPRKNHSTIVDAFDDLWRRGVPINLVIVGSHGWHSEVFLSRVANHPMANRRLFLFRRTTDAQLALLYGQTTALIIASVAEGFGLPIVEAFQRGARVICSDIPVFREIAGGKALYFDPTNHNELADRILVVTKTVEETKDIQNVGASWLTWSDSAKDILQKTVYLNENHDHPIKR